MPLPRVIVPAVSVPATVAAVLEAKPSQTVEVCVVIVGVAPCELIWPIKVDVPFIVNVELGIDRDPIPTEPKKVFGAVPDATKFHVVVEFPSAVVPRLIPDTIP